MSKGQYGGPTCALSRQASLRSACGSSADRCALEARPGKWGWSIGAAAGGAAWRVERRPSAGVAVKGQRGQARRRVAWAGPWSAGGGCEGSCGLRAPGRWSVLRSRRWVALRASVALAGATGGGQLGSVCQRGGGAERVARSRGGAAAARAAWVGCGLIHSGALHNPRLEPTALSRWPAEVVEPAAEVLSGGSSPGPRGGSAASR